MTSNNNNINNNNIINKSSNFGDDDDEYNNYTFETMFQSVSIQQPPTFIGSSIVGSDPFANFESIASKNQNTSNNDNNKFFQTQNNKDTTTAATGSTKKTDFIAATKTETVFDMAPSTKRATTINWVWTVSNIPTIPFYHPLEPTALILPIDSSSFDATATTVSGRISNFLRQHSISATYQKYIVDCKTMSLLKFAVLLWKKDNNHMAIEVQRRQGCTIEMRTLRSQLYQAISTPSSSNAINTSEQKDSTESLFMKQKQQTARTPNSFLPNSIPEGNEWIEKICPTIDNGQMALKHQQTLKMCFHMISSIRYDEQRLGLETLIVLTDSSKSHHAHEVSDSILLNMMYQNALARFFCNVERPSPEQQNPKHSYDEYDSDDDEMDEDDGMFAPEYLHGNNHGELHMLALRVLSNVLYLAASRAATVTVDGSSFWNNVVYSLIYNVQVATYRPQEASLSMNCLQSLLQTQNHILDPNHRKLLIPVIEQACAYGKAHHYLLEQESQQMLAELAY